MADDVFPSSLPGERPLAQETILRRPGTLVLPSRRIVAVLAIMILLLLLFSLAGQYAVYFLGRPTVFGLVEFFYVDLENNFPTWYQSVNLLFAAMLLAAAGHDARRRGSRFALHWFLLALGFFALSMDEVASVHERLIDPLERVISPTGIWKTVWVIPGVAVVAIAGIAFLPFLLHLRRREQLHVLCAAALFTSGALATEMVTSMMFDTTDLNFKNNFTYAVMTHIEEGLEMIGLLVFIDFLLRRLDGVAPIQLAVAADRAAR